MAEVRITRHALLWLFAAQLAVIAPHLPILPFWTALVWGLVALWYWKIYRGDWHFPGRAMTWGLSLIAVVGVAVEYRTALELEPQVALLVTAFILKLLELKTLRDHWLLLMLAYFLVACSFIFSTSIGAVVIALGQLIILLLAQQSLFRPQLAVRPMMRQTLRVFAQSIPLMLVLFVVFPRFGPLWSVPLPGESAKTGMSDSMAPGDVSRLSRSSELAFRASFDGPIPAQPDLYWRGLVLEHFDGRSWGRDRIFIRPPLNAGIERGGADPVRYEVILEHGVHDWLLAIAPAEIERRGAYQDTNYQWLTRSALSGRVRYEVVSYPGAPLTQANPYNLAKNRKLPQGYNPRMRALAADWEKLEEPAARVAAAERYFRSQPFVYTLEPPKLGTHSMDDFLFGSRRGFCEHYASSFVGLMRAAGVPARVVVGYQGGERNEAGNYLLVHQSDAHAWSEVWLEGQGWVRVDPTAWVAPDRIELGADVALAGEANFLADNLVSLRRFSGFTAIAQLRLLMDRVEYQWVRWIVNFDSERQWDILTRLFDNPDNRKLALLLLIALAFPLLLSALLTISWRRGHRQAPEVRLYERCCARLERCGIVRSRGEAPGDFACRVEREMPEWADWFHGVTAVFSRASYQPIGSEAFSQSLSELKRLEREGPTRRWSLKHLGRRRA
ncbi:transglutaminase-like putative cysteine protease [Litorivivens lipolytica]|uniref:Transglutaminase-like putative cysteine protease n=1 Tax=Litorivivens lipolytica TaxID=1524264 RepID=A0A7W4Z4M2_9GAMM|nr:DUF3488 and transglutaminase-like domain-containing protein [Litorivivens lipolytica]MBB3046263.1 transglutaminase-like putative cysteine protease [Litorivivens lipolytica]